MPDLSARVVSKVPEIISDYNDVRIKTEDIKTKYGIDGSILYHILDKNQTNRRLGRFFQPASKLTMAKKFGTMIIASRENLEVGSRTEDGGLVLKKVVVTKGKSFEYTLNYGQFKTVEEAHV